MLSGVALADPAPEKLEDQPSTERSYMIGDSTLMNDIELSNAFRKAVTTDGLGLGPDILDATFLFNSCFGGGMLDDIRDKMPRGVRWIGGSASIHGERAVGEVTNTEALGNTPSRFVNASPKSYWTKALVPALTSEATVLEALVKAEKDDVVGPKGAIDKLENPQWTYGSGGEDIVLTNPDATSRYAVLWGGRAAENATRHYNNLAAVRAMLVTAWGLPVDTDRILVFAGANGGPAPGGGAWPADWHVRPGNGDPMRIIIGALHAAMGPNSQFFFYATGHGSSSKKFEKPTFALGDIRGSRPEMTVFDFLKRIPPTSLTRRQRRNRAAEVIRGSEVIRGGH
jgi:hypothetical protein